VETEKCHHEGEGNVIPEEGWDVIQKKASVYWDLYVPRITEENGIMYGPQPQKPQLRARRLGLIDCS